MEMDSGCTGDSLPFNLHEILVRDDEAILCIESFLFLGIRIVFLTIVQLFRKEKIYLFWEKMAVLVRNARALQN